MRLVRVATCNLNQWSLDFSGNLERICRSIDEARRAGARYRLGPELEVSGYGCEDHFFESDTFMHSWEVIAQIIARGCTDNILVDVGAPVLHRHVAYNCRVLLLNRRVVLIRPKLALADDGNYRESRWFAAWPANGERALELYPLPDCVQKVTAFGQRSTLIGEALLDIDGVVVASETCEELFTPNAPHIRYSLNGCDLIGNGSGSHHNLRKLDQRIDLLRSATAKGGGAYLYANQQGCDGGRLYYDGCALICVNGKIVAQASQFSIASEVEVVVANIDLDQVTAYRIAIASRGVQAASACPLPRVDQFGQWLRTENFMYPGEHFSGPWQHAWTQDRDPGLESDTAANRRVPDAHEVANAQTTRFCLLMPASEQLAHVPSPAIPVRLHTAEEEIAYGPACWLWDYLRRSGMSGFFLPLSGGADSSATATLVGSMCRLVATEAQKGNEHVICEARPHRRPRIGPRHGPRHERWLCSVRCSRVRLTHSSYRVHGQRKLKQIDKGTGSTARQRDRCVSCGLAYRLGCVCGHPGLYPRDGTNTSLSAPRRHLGGERCVAEYTSPRSDGAQFLVRSTAALGSRKWPTSAAGTRLCQRR
ncbi:glutamine-dependent NAD [Cyanidiococcus yangmingshanensis]|uniref:NAD(+) synthase [glutamine-hydrolyzing] n=1 Tax=Cyanidiococcus yangmingshanensis TaxID=2690220 RepID=A0A7J7IQX5_9RHOD|nr:glutamine-dependent NAD [Cyanidiococcus yangmingshanensis]